MRAIDALMPEGERLLVKLPSIRGPVADVRQSMKTVRVQRQNAPKNSKAST